MENIFLGVGVGLVWCLFLFFDCCWLTELCRATRSLLWNELYAKSRVDWEEKARESSKVDTLSANIFSLVLKLAYSLEPTDSGGQTGLSFQVNVFDEGQKVFPTGKSGERTTTKAKRQVMGSAQKLLTVIVCFFFVFLWKWDTLMDYNSRGMFKTVSFASYS